jgi:hypothetical protein
MEDKVSGCEDGGDHSCRVEDGGFDVPLEKRDGK